MNKKIVIAITGASGSIYAKSILTILKNIPAITTAVVLSGSSKEVADIELGENAISKENYPEFTFYKKDDFQAPFASGSSSFTDMIILPCSMGTLGRVANGISNDLISRAADVFLKERKNIIFVVRETPYNLIHLENMKTITLSGGIVCPATPSFYSLPKTIEQLVDTVVHRVCNLAKIPVKSFKWNED